MAKGKIEIFGKPVDGETRCEHYHSLADVIAIKFKCCDRYYPCYQCHEETTDHAAQTWRKDEWGTKAVLCGVCKAELTVNEYMHSNDQCPNCGAAFNPNCSKHYHLYFQT